MRYIPYSRQDINEEDIKTVTEVLLSDYITTGPSIEEFEQSIKNYCRAENAVAISSATAGLHVCLLALGIGKGDIVWTSPISFVASSNAALYVGADVDFVDVDPLTGNMDIEKLSEKLSEAERRENLPDVLIVVHFSGRTCDMQAIAELSKRYGFAVLEDAAHALGAKYQDDSPVGNGKYSDATIFSFHPVKSIATGEGGMITTNNKELAERMRLFRSHGITRDISMMQNESHGAWYYEQLHLGLNYRMTDIQAALGVSQMKRLNHFIQQRNNLAGRYSTLLKDLPLILPPEDDNSAWHIYVIHVAQSAKISRKELFDKLRNEGIGVNVHYIPIHLQPYYKKLGFKYGDFPNAEDFYSRAISIPLFPSLKESEQDFVAEKLAEFLV